MKDSIRRLPREFLERLKSIFPPRKFDELVNTFSEKSPLSFRVNTTKALPPEIKEKMSAQGLVLESVPWCQEAFIVKNKKTRDLTETDFYKEGLIYLQSLSSLIPPLILAPQAGELVLDLTAAPGSKTTQMANLMANQGKIVAMDNNRLRFYKLQANLRLQGVSIVEPRLYPGELAGRDYPEYFDKVLLDAPCSAEGRFQVFDPRSYSYWKVKKIKEMSRKQKCLLLSGSRALKVGGCLVYSTCTFAPEENEAVIDWLLEKLGGAIKTEEIKFPLPNLSCALKSWQGKSFAGGMRAGVRILPTPNMEGFFICKLRKLKTLLPPSN